MPDTKATKWDWAAIAGLVTIAIMGIGARAAQEIDLHQQKVAARAVSSGLCTKTGPNGHYVCHGFLAKKTAAGVEYAALVSLDKGKMQGLRFNVRGEVAAIDNDFDDCLTGGTACDSILAESPTWAETQEQCLAVLSPRLSAYSAKEQAQLRKIACKY